MARRSWVRQGAKRPTHRQITRGGGGSRGGTRVRANRGARAKTRGSRPEVVARRRTTRATLSTGVPTHQGIFVPIARRSSPKFRVGARPSTRCRIGALASLARTSDGAEGAPLASFPRIIFGEVCARRRRDPRRWRVPQPSRRAVSASRHVVSRRRSRRILPGVRSRRVAGLVADRVRGPRRSSRRTTVTRTWSVAARATARAPSTASG